MPGLPCTHPLYTTVMLSCVCVCVAGSLIPIKALCVWLSISSPHMFFAKLMSHMHQQCSQILYDWTAISADSTSTCTRRATQV